MKLFNKKNKGFTLIEILIAVGFIAVAGIGIYTIYAKVQVGNQSNTEARNLDTLRAGVKILYGGRPNFAGLSNVVVNNARVTPDSMRIANDTATITNTFGGGVTVAPATFAPGTDNAFSITYPGVPSAVCSRLVTSAGVQFNDVTVGGTNVKAFGKNDPIDVPTAAAQCGASDTTTIVFSSL